MGAPASGYTITPIVVNNVMYLPIQGSTIVALKADAGTELWKFDLKTIPGIAPNPSAGGRGISYWPGTPQTGPRIVIATTNGFLVQLNAKTGAPVPGPAGIVESVHGHHGEVRRQLLDEHAAGALQESGDHRGAHRRTGPLRAARAIRARSIS